MSLQVWLPLNGDLHNQGLSNLTITNNGATIDDNGKIGKCYSFNSNYIKITDLSIPINTWSLTAWAYPQADTSSGHQYIVGINTSSASDFLGVLCFYQNKFGIRTAGTTYSSPNTSALNHWYHICATYDGTDLKLYVNGILVLTKNSPAAPKAASTCYIGTRGGITGNFHGKINDVRIYDHCLSDKEVEEISKGLVLHYKLDNIINTNLLENIPKSHSPTEYCGYQLNLKENLIAGQIYTIQLWDVDITHTGKTASNIGFSVYWGGGSVGLLHRNGSSYYDYYDEDSHSVHADYLCFTFTPTEANANHANAANLWLNIYNSVSNANGTRNMHIGAWKLEKGDVATAYGDNNGIVYDSSGYNNNGTIVGDLTTDINNSRYSYSTVFNGTSRIMANSLPAETKTLTCWAKTTKNKSTSQQIVADSNSALTISFYQGTIIGVFGTTRSTGSKSTLGSEYKENNWNFFAVVKTSDDGKRDIYCNGIKLTPTSNDYWGAATGFFIGARNTSQGNPFYGEINDVRAYVTALTPEQILELYNTSATIDNQGNVYAREVIE